VNKLTSKKNYPHPVGMLLDTINDIVELQKGKLTFSDTPNGKIHFLIRMYAYKWELRFDVTDIGDNRSRVQIEIEGDESGKEELLRREFALLDSMLVAGAENKL